MIECWNCHSQNPRSAEYCSCVHLRSPAPLRLGRYRVQGFLGEGTFGKVYRCEDELIGRDVAVKKLRMLRPDQSQALQEINLAGRLDHPNIVRLYDADADTGLIVMEYVEGGSLADWIAADPDNVRANFTPIFLGVCEGLRAAHIERLIHRDVKPANILMKRDGSPKIADFGLARLLGDDEFALSRVGSPAYMAPEVILGEPYGLEADLHSLGCVMYEVWTGERPFNQPGGLMALAAQKSTATFLPLRAIDASVDDVLNDLVARMLSGGPSRIKSVEAVIQQLRHRDPRPTESGVESIDDMQLKLGSIYGFVNGGRSPLLLLTQFLVSVRGFADSFEEPDPATRKDGAEFMLLRAFAWLSALASSLNVRLGQLVWLKYDGVCPYCSQDECVCNQRVRLSEREKNTLLLQSVAGRKPSHAPSPKTFAQYQATFRRIYGSSNIAVDATTVLNHVYSEVAEAAEAILRLESLDDAEAVLILHLEVSDLVAWFFAMLNIYDPDYAFVEEFESMFEEGCYACSKYPCRCPGMRHERALANWKPL